MFFFLHIFFSSRDEEKKTIKGKKKKKTMMVVFDHFPFPGPTVSASLVAASRAAGEAYARRVLLPGSWGDEGEEEEGGRRRQPLPPKWPSPAAVLSCPSLSSASFASVPSPPPSTDCPALLQGLMLAVGVARGGGGDDDEGKEYGRVLPLEPSSSSSCPSPSLTRPSLLDLTRDEDALLFLETKVKAREVMNVRPRLDLFVVFFAMFFWFCSCSFFLSLSTADRL